MRTIPLTQGYLAIVDDIDYEWLMQWKWHARLNEWGVYAARQSPRGHFPRKSIGMHNEILKVNNGFQVDHIDRNGLNNQRHNLRQATASENTINRKLPKSNKSGFRGVTFHKNAKRWRATIKKNGRQNHIGYFATAEQAANAYDIKAKEIHGEFASLNFPHDERRW